MAHLHQFLRIFSGKHVTPASHKKSSKLKKKIDEQNDKIQKLEQDKANLSDELAKEKAKSKELATVNPVTKSTLDSKFQEGFELGYNKRREEDIYHHEEYLRPMYYWERALANVTSNIATVVNTIYREDEIKELLERYVSDLEKYLGEADRVNRKWRAGGMSEAINLTVFQQFSEAVADYTSGEVKSTARIRTLSLQWERFKTLATEVYPKYKPGPGVWTETDLLYKLIQDVTTRYPRLRTNPQKAAKIIEILLDKQENTGLSTTEKNILDTLMISKDPANLIAQAKSRRKNRDTNLMKV